MSEPYYNGALYTGGGLAGVAALNIIVYLAFIDGPSMSDIVAFIVGIIGVLAGMQKVGCPPSPPFHTHALPLARARFPRPSRGTPRSVARSPALSLLPPSPTLLRCACARPNHLPLSQNKGLLIAYMVLTIIVVIWFITAVMAFSLLVAGCGIVSSVADAFCTAELADGTSVPYCCNACADATTCESNGCDYVDSYTSQYCGLVPDGTAGTGPACGALEDSDVTADWDETTPCSSIDYDACNAIAVAYPNIGVDWVSQETGGVCRDGSPLVQYSAPAVTAANCRTDANADASDSCTKSFCVVSGASTTCFSNQNVDNSGGFTYEIPAGAQAVGCHAETEGGETENLEDLCDWVNLIWFTMFLTVVFGIAGSVMGCCVVCCGKGDDKEDSG